MEETHGMKGLIEFVARELVDQPEEVSVTEVPIEGGTRLELRVADDDLGRVIGREGRVAKSIRTILRAASARDDKHRFMLEIIEGDKLRAMGGNAVEKNNG